MNFYSHVYSLQHSSVLHHLKYDLSTSQDEALLCRCTCGDYFRNRGSMVHLAFRNAVFKRLAVWQLPNHRNLLFLLCSPPHFAVTQLHSAIRLDDALEWDLNPLISVYRYRTSSAFTRL